MRRAILLALLALVGLAPSASALTWSATKELPGRMLDVDVFDPPEVAVNAKGDFVVSWVGDGVAVATSRRSVSRPLRYPAEASGSYELGIDKDATSVMSWLGLVSDADNFEAHYAMITPSGKVGPMRSFGRSSSGVATFVAHPRGGFIAFYHRGSHVIAARLFASGTIGTRTDLGRSSDEDEVEAAGAPGGQIIVSGFRGTGGRRAVATSTSSGGWKTRTVGTGESTPSIATAGGAFLWSTGGRRPALHLLRGGVVTDTPLPKSLPTGGWALDRRGRAVNAAVGQDKQLLLTVTTSPLTLPGSPLAAGSARSASDNDLPRVAAFGDSVLVAYTDRSRWTTGLVTSDGTLAPAATSPTGVAAYTGLTTFGSRAVLAWYDHNHHAMVALAKG